MKDKLNRDKFIFNQKAIKYLADVVSESNLTEIEYKCADISIKISKNGPAAAPMQNYAPMPMQMPLQPSEIPLKQALEAKPASEKRSVTAPVVGKIYVAEKPGLPALIKVGDKVEVGQKIFIIEAMKVMNNVKSTESGTISKILVQDGQAVEFGQKLVELE